MNFESLKRTPRLLVSVELAPLQGTRFQPTGFPDIGAATYDAPDGKKMLLVESTQSMANRMEAACWDSARDKPTQPLEGLPFVAVNDQDGKPLTNSIVEAHRINSAYILNATDSEIDKVFTEKFGKKGKDKNETRGFGNAERQELVSLIFKYDTATLLHGVFMPLYAGGRCRIPRALSAFVEAEGVSEAVSGGVKNDVVNPSKSEGKTAEEGFGNIPYARSEYTGQMKAYFSLDLSQIRNYGLGEDAEKLLIGLALYKIRRVLDDGLRFRTACDLKAGKITVNAPEGFSLPSQKDLSESLPGLLKNCKDSLGGSPSVTATYVQGKKNKKSKDQEEEQGESDEKDEAEE